MKRTSDSTHWDSIYRKYERNQLGWFARILSTSLEWITKYAAGPDSSILDVGGGSSTLADELLKLSYSDISVLDLSKEALDEVETRLRSAFGDKPLGVQFVCADVRDPDLSLRPMSVWHDRAAFHFMVEAPEIVAYQRLAARSILPGGALILGVFTPNAPPTCSGLSVNRHTAEGLFAIFGADFDLIETKTEMHVTPGGIEQEYLYTAWRRKSDLT